MPHRVLVVGEYGTRNGGENSFLAVAPALMKLGWEFHAAVPAHSEFANALHAADIVVHDFSLKTLDGQRKSQVEIRSDIANLIGFVQPKLIHCNSLSTSRICGPVARSLRQPSLGYLRDILKLSKQAVADINMLDRIIAVSAATRTWHGNQGVDLSKTLVVYNGVDTDLFFPMAGSDQAGVACPIRTELGIPVDSPVLLFAGQIGIRKGVDTLIDAFLKVAELIPQIQLLIAGSRHSQKQEAVEFENQLKCMIELSKYKNNVHWLGTRTDITLLMRTATILVHPARQEPLGRVLLEAAASGLPIITTRVGGSPEILSRDGFDAFLIEPDDPIELAERILNLINDPQRLEELKVNLRETANLIFSIQNCSRGLDAQYRWLLEQ